MKVFKYSSKIQANYLMGKGFKVYAADDVTDDADDAEFGDPTDEKVSGDVEETFNRLVDMLRKTSYEDLGPALEDIVDDPKLYAILKEGFESRFKGSAAVSHLVYIILLKELLRLDKGLCKIAPDLSAYPGH